MCLNIQVVVFQTHVLAPAGRGRFKNLSIVPTVDFSLAWSWRVAQGVGFWQPAPAACL